MNQIKHIRLDKIQPPEFDARLTTSPEDDEDLANSVKELGILEPLLVKDIGGSYEIIAGNRRFRAGGVAGLAAAPCIVIKTTGSETDKIQLHENLKRLDLNHVDQGYTFAHLIHKYDMTETQIANLIHKSVAYVSQHLSLLQTDPVLLAAVSDGRINFSVARELMRCKDTDEMVRLGNLVSEHGATTGVVRNWVDESNRETDNFEHDHKLQTQTHSDIEPIIPHYPCSVCRELTKYDEIRTIRMCPGCHNLFFLEIEQSKQQQRKEMNANPT